MALPSFHSLTKYYLQDINQINTHADEMDLFTMVTRRFKKVFSKQEQMRTFPVYDASIEVSQVHNNCILNTLIPNIATGAHTITRSLPFKRAKRNKKKSELFV